MEKDEYFLMVNNSLRRVRDVSMDIPPRKRISLLVETYIFIFHFYDIFIVSFTDRIKSIVIIPI